MGILLSKLVKVVGRAIRLHVIDLMEQHPRLLTYCYLPPKEMF